jgi:redox-sensitive bicupin YhaK (pirin superfamily)
MIQVIPYNKLGQMQTDWLDSRFHFAFSGVNAPMGMGFGPLRVWNDDLIAPQTGFGMHGHRDMEIITYVRKGAISHRDSLGNEGRTVAGDVQVMHAGTGIMHSEWNKEYEHTLLYQIWVEPNRRGLAPGWAEARFPKADRAGKWVPLASGEDGVAGALPIHQDATLYGGFLPKGSSLTHVLRPGRRAYLVLADGALTVNGKIIGTRDGIALADVPSVDVVADADSEALLIDLP